MDLPDFPDLSDAILHAVLDRMGAGRQRIERLPGSGIFNAIFAVGDDLILRVPRHHPAFVSAARKEALAVPCARRCGVRTPRLVAFDESLDLLPVPCALYERSPGRNAGSAHAEPEAAREMYRELGRDLAKLHAGAVRSEALSGLALEPMDPAHVHLEALVTGGYLTPLESRWFARWLGELERGSESGFEPVLLHGDVQVSNLMVDDDGGYLALLDWGGAGWGDPAYDFAGVPLRAVPFMLQGYQILREPEPEGALEARIVRRHLQLALYLLRRPPQPGRSWAERPQAMMLEVFRFFLESSDPVWLDLHPPRPTAGVGGDLA